MLKMLQYLNLQTINYKYVLTTWYYSNAISDVNYAEPRLSF